MPAPASRLRSSRTVFIVVALGLTLVFAVALAVMAVISTVYHRSTAERVLRDYAAFAAEQYVNRSQQRLATAVFPVLTALAPAGRPGGVLPSRDAAPPPVRATKGWFRLTLPPGDLRLEGIAPDPELSRWLTDSVGAHARTRYRREWYMAFEWHLDRTPELVAVYTVARDSAGVARTAYGALLAPDSVIALLRAVAENAPLLPASLTGGVLVDSVAAVHVTGPGNRELVATRRYDSPFRAMRPFDAIFGPLSAAITLRPELAPQLIIGGLPRSRLPLVMGTLVLTGLLIAAAIVQLRREQELIRQRSDFVASVSHELRTPLAQIRMFAETLLLGRVRSDDEQQRSLRIMDQEARRLSHLVDNLLFVARGERTRIQLARVETDLSSLVRDIGESVVPLAAARRMTVRFEVAPGVRSSVDPAAFRQVVLNLLDNALKYAPPETDIRVGLTSAAGRATLAVDDAGPGVPVADRQRIWERFARLDRDIESPVAGSGIGLAIVRELVEAHGGSARVEDAPAGGARFVVELPA